MESESVNIIRESNRNLLTISRKDYRNRELDKTRPFEHSSEEVLSVANKLKGKTISQLDLVVLRNRIADNVKMVDVILSVNGSMRGLVREISGTSARKQVLACACLCNMCAVSTRATKLCAKEASAYLYSALDSFNIEFVVTSAWCLGNMAAGGISQCNVITALGCHMKLLQTLNTTDNEDVRVAALYAVVHYVYVMKDQICQEYIQKCLEAAANIDITVLSTQLLFYISCHKDFTETLSESYIIHMCARYLDYLEKHYQNLGRVQWEVVYILRVLANMCSDHTNCDVVLSNVKDCALFGILLQDARCENSVKCLLSNVYKYSTDAAMRNYFLNKLFV